MSETSRRQFLETTGLISAGILAAFSYRGLRLFREHNERREEVRLPEINQFASEMDHFSDGVQNDRKPRTPGEEGLADLRVIEAIAEAAETGKAVKVKG